MMAYVIIHVIVDRTDLWKSLDKNISQLASYPPSNTIQKHMNKNALTYYPHLRFQMTLLCLLMKFDLNRCWISLSVVAFIFLSYWDSTAIPRHKQYSVFNSRQFATYFNTQIDLEWFLMTCDKIIVTRRWCLYDHPFVSTLLSSMFCP